MYLGRNHISNLSTFIAGLMMSEFVYKNQDNYFGENGFLNWYIKKYKPQESSFWQDYFLSETDNDEVKALELYFERLEEYYNDTISTKSKFSTKTVTKTNFKLWLEFEEVHPNSWDIKNEFCNIHVDLEDGRHYGICVWTYKFFETAIIKDKEAKSNLYGLYQIPPDLFVEELTRDCIQKTIEDLLKIGDLEKVLNPSVYDRSLNK
jgi:hypothetical protein